VAEKYKLHSSFNERIGVETASVHNMFDVNVKDRRIYYKKKEKKWKEKAARVLTRNVIPYR